MGETSDNRILVDSDAFVGWLKPDDSLHERVTILFGRIKEQKQATVTTSLVVAETATTLSNKVSQEAAIRFLDFVEHLPVIHIGEDLHRKTTELFKQQKEKGISFVDCSNVVVLKHFGMPAILSFDKFYSKKFGLKMAA